MSNVELVIKRLSVGQLEANCYLVWDGESMEGIVIDPGDEGEFISEVILRERVDLKAIVLTHGHFDHVQGALALKLNFEVPVMMGLADRKIYRDSAKSMKYWTKVEGGEVPKIDRGIKEGSVIKFGGISLRVIKTPGHTPGSVCIYSKKNNVLFSGDTLFRDGVGRTDFKYSSKEDLDKSLERLKKLPKETRVLPGHGDETTIGLEFNL